MHNPAYRAHVTRCAAINAKPLTYAKWAAVVIRAMRQA